MAHCSSSFALASVGQRAGVGGLRPSTRSCASLAAPCLALRSPWAGHLPFARITPGPVLAAAATSGGGGGGSAGGSGGGSGGGGGDGSSQPSSHPMRPWTFLLAALLAVGGVMGFVKGRSPKSLGGGLSGALILALAARAMAGPSLHAGVRVAFGVTLLLGVFFVSRYTKTRKIFPAGVGAGVTLTYAAAFVATGL